MILMIVMTNGAVTGTTTEAAIAKGTMTVTMVENGNRKQILFKASGHPGAFFMLINKQRRNLLLRLP